MKGLTRFYCTVAHIACCGAAGYIIEDHTAVSIALFSVGLAFCGLARREEAE
jgi:hypothetical protein